MSWLRAHCERFSARSSSTFPRGSTHRPYSAPCEHNGFLSRLSPGWHGYALRAWAAQRTLSHSAHPTCKGRLALTEVLRVVDAMSILELDEHLFTELATHLDPTALVSLGLTCRALHDLATHTVRPYAAPDACPSSRARA